jgi:hypothetical protein
MRLTILLLAVLAQLIGAQVVLAAEPLGRLFSTPEERQHLERLREAQKNQPIETDTVVEATVIERKPIVLPSAINVQGFVKRSDGKLGTVWVNDEAIQERSGNKDVQVGTLSKHSNRIPIRIPANGRRLILKAGQVYEPEKNRVRQSKSYKIRRHSGRIGDD